MIMKLVNILNQLTELDKKWYQEKKKFFKMEPLYDSKNDFIYVNWGSYETDFYDENTGQTHRIEVPHRELEVYDITLLEYCWNSYFDGSLASMNLDYDEDGPIEIHNLPADVEPIKDDVLKYLEYLFRDKPAPSLKVRALRKVLKKINTALNLQDKSDEFNILNNNIYKGIKQAIYSQHGNSFELNDLTTIKAEVKSKPLTKTLNLPFYSFEYINAGKNPESIKDVYDGLKNANLIAINTSLPIFKKVFTNKEITEKIVWSGLISELAYFIKFIHNINQSVKDTSKKHWEIASQCFVLEGNISVTAQQLHDAKRPKTFQKIEGIALNFE